MLIAPFVQGGLPAILSGFPQALENPFDVTWCDDTLSCAVVLLLVYALGLGIYYTGKKNRRWREEHGSARWGDSLEISRRYEDRSTNRNKLLTQNVKIGLDGKKHRRNINTVVVGGSGAGKTRFFAKPNIMECNCSYVVLDPKGEILRDTGRLLEKQGYEIRVLDLKDMRLSHGYNPFRYVATDNDVQRLVTNLFKSTTPKESKTQDPYWDRAASELLSALSYALLHWCYPHDQNFGRIMDMIREGEVREDDEDYQSPLDDLFSEIEARSPEDIAVRYYKDYRSAPAKTIKSIQTTLASHLEKFNLDSVISLTTADELDLPTLGEKKVALFAVIPDNDTSFNFLVSVLYTQLFQQLFDLADNKYGGSLPVPVHFLMDEFANVALPDDFEKILSVMRSRNVFVSIILQNLAQLKALFKDSWESIVGNCDTLLYLGGNEQSTHKYISELLGKATIDTNTYGRTTGQHGSYSKNDQQAGRELLTPDEVRLLDNEKALLFIRGERPVLDRKYDILKHTNVAWTTDGKGVHRHIPASSEQNAPYQHGKVSISTATIELFPVELKPEQAAKLPQQGKYKPYSDEELETLFGI